MSYWLPFAEQYFIQCCQEKFDPLQILPHHPFPRKISTLAESEVDRHAEQIHCGQRCVWKSDEKQRENASRVYLCECYGEWEADRPACYLIVNTHAVFLGSAGARVWCWLSSVPANRWNLSVHDLKLLWGNTRLCRVAEDRIKRDSRTVRGSQSVRACAWVTMLLGAKVTDDEVCKSSDAKAPCFTTTWVPGFCVCMSWHWYKRRNILSHPNPQPKCHLQ